MSISVSTRVWENVYRRDSQAVVETDSTCVMSVLLYVILYTINSSSNEGLLQLEECYQNFKKHKYSKTHMEDSLRITMNS